MRILTALFFSLSALALFGCDSAGGSTSVGTTGNTQDQGAGFAHSVTYSQAQVCHLDSADHYVYSNPTQAPVEWRAVLYTFGGVKADGGIGFVPGKGFQIYLAPWACPGSKIWGGMSSGIQFMADSSITIYWN